VIVESPAKAKTIEGFLGRDTVRVVASYGHVRDLPSSAKEVPKSVTDKEVRRLGIDVEDHFRPVYVIPDQKKERVKALKAALADASEVYLATDEDREGEAISWHVLEVLKPRVPVKRMVFHEITAPAIEAALADWRELDMKLVEAQEGRRILDRLFGYEMSLVARRRAGGAVSAGRVQSVASCLVVDRERARMAFRVATYWDLAGTFRAADHDDTDFPATLSSVDGSRLATGKDFDPATGQLADGSGVTLLGEAEAAALVEQLRDAQFRVASVENKAVTERPKPPFTTSTLQQEAARKLGFSAARAMSVAQALYENGYITYMRTDSTNLSEQALTAARSRIESLYGKEYLPAEARTYRGKVKNAQEAHEAIRPAGDAMLPVDDVGGNIDGDPEIKVSKTDAKRLYDLVWKRTVASQMQDARVQRVTARLEAQTGGAGGAAHAVVFNATGRTIEFPGYLRAYVEGADDPDAELEDREAILPPLAEGDAVDCRELNAASHTTQPPARYTEASLVKELEERGIGRPSTYAAVIDTLLRRDYVWKKGTALVPSWTAFAKQQLFERHFPHLIDYEFTATMEEALDAIARGEAEAEKWLHTFWFGNGVAGLKELVNDDHLATIDPAEVNAVPIGHDAQGREIIVRVWNNGASLVRGDDKAPVPVDLPPDELTIAMAEELIERGSGGPRVLGNDPETGMPVLALTGRYGPFVQLGEMEEGTKDKPKRASLFASMQPDTVTLDEALALLALPRVVGSSDGEEVSALNGRYGPYLKKGDDSRSLDAEEQLFTVTIEQAEALFAQPKRRRGRAAKPPIADLGAHPDSGASVRVLDGRFGPYVTDGTINATVPRGIEPSSIDLEQAVELLREREARGPATKRTRPAKTTKRVVKKGTSKTSKKGKAKKAAKATKKVAVPAPAEPATDEGQAETDPLA
jgi:DNA topoisomerase-1